MKGPFLFSENRDLDPHSSGGVKDVSSENKLQRERYFSQLNFTTVLFFSLVDALEGSLYLEVQLFC